MSLGHILYSMYVLNIWVNIGSSMVSHYNHVGPLTVRLWVWALLNLYPYQECVSPIHLIFRWVPGPIEPHITQNWLDSHLFYLRCTGRKYVMYVNYALVKLDLRYNIKYRQWAMQQDWKSYKIVGCKLWLPQWNQFYQPKISAWSPACDVHHVNLNMSSQLPSWFIMETWGWGDKMASGGKM